MYVFIDRVLSTNPPPVVMYAISPLGKWPGCLERFKQTFFKIKRLFRACGAKKRAYAVDGDEGEGEGEEEEGEQDEEGEEKEVEGEDGTRKDVEEEGTGGNTVDDAKSDDDDGDDDDGDDDGGDDDDGDDEPRQRCGCCSKRRSKAQVVARSEIFEVTGSEEYSAVMTSPSASGRRGRPRAALVGE